jgi:amidase
MKEKRMLDIPFRSAKQLASLIHRKKIGCVELLDTYLQRIERYNPKLNAIICLSVEAARQRARQADSALARGDIWGPLHGVPMTIKESYDVVGTPTTWGIPQYKDNYPTKNALVVERLLNAGVVLFGKTNVPLNLADWQTFNEIYGTTNNPWDVARGPGGSSGGSAAALAAGLTGLEAGSDIGASIRNPAHYCGVYGHKPTYSIVSPRGQALPVKCRSLTSLWLAPWRVVPRILPWRLLLWLGRTRSTVWAGSYACQSRNIRHCVTIKLPLSIPMQRQRWMLQYRTACMP